MRKEWVVIFTVEAVNRPKRKKLLKICSVNSTNNDLFCNYILSNLSGIMATDIRAILKFVLRSKCFCHMELEQ